MRVVGAHFLAVLHDVHAAHAHRLDQVLAGIAHLGVDRARHARQRTVAQGRQRGRGDGVVAHHVLEALTALDHAQVQPPGVAGALGGFRGIEGLERDLQGGGRLGQRLQHAGGRLGVGAVDVDHGDVRHVGRFGFGLQTQLEQVFLERAAHLRVQDGVDLLRQAVDDAIGGLVGAEFGLIECAVVDGRGGLSGAGGGEQAEGGQVQCAFDHGNPLSLLR
ncbi:hypothetical protein D3C85_1053850 [compost metagenome]